MRTAWTDYSVELPTERRIILATDATNTEVLEAYARQFGNVIGAIGLNPDIHVVREASLKDALKIVRGHNASLFLDAELFRVPYKMGNAVTHILHGYRPHFLTVPASVGPDALEAARIARDEHYKKVCEDFPMVKMPKICAMLPFPDMTREQCFRMFHREPEEVADDMTRWSIESGIDGIVCGPREIEICKFASQRQQDFTVVAAGIRRACHISRFGKDLSGSKEEVCLPSEALLRGADMVIIGKTLTGVDVTDKIGAYREIFADMALAQ